MVCLHEWSRLTGRFRNRLELRHFHGFDLMVLHRLDVEFKVGVRNAVSLLSVVIMRQDPATHRDKQDIRWDREER